MNSINLILIILVVDTSKQNQRLTDFVESRINDSNSFSNAVIAFVYHGSALKVNRVIVFPRMVGNVRATRIVFKISLMFLSSGFKASASFSYITPTAVRARNFVDNIAL